MERLTVWKHERGGVRLGWSGADETKESREWQQRGQQQRASRAARASRLGWNLSIRKQRSVMANKTWQLSASCSVPPSPPPPACYISVDALKIKSVPAFRVYSKKTFAGTSTISEDFWGKSWGCRTCSNTCVHPCPQREWVGWSIPCDSYPKSIRLYRNSNAQLLLIFFSLCMQECKNFPPIMGRPRLDQLRVHSSHLWNCLLCVRCDLFLGGKEGNSFPLL